MKLQLLELLTLGLASATYTCATQEAPVSQPLLPVTSWHASEASTRGDGGLVRAPPTANECEATFRLCAAYVKTSEVADLPHASGHWVGIELTEDGRQSFEAFTKVWLRRSACVMLGSELVITTPVRAVIPSGRLMAVRSSAREARELVDKLQAAPEAPCGS